MTPWGGGTAQERRICWPDPDVVCLQGGCGYCNSCDFQTVESIRLWAMRQPEYIWKAFVDGRSNNFHNAETR